MSILWRRRLRSARRAAALASWRRGTLAGGGLALAGALLVALLLAGRPHPPVGATTGG